MPGPVINDPKIMLALPSYDGSRYNGVHICNAQGSVVTTVEIQFSILTACFNRLWARMLNWRDEGKLTHFIMLHADIKPLIADWVGEMYKELIASGADILSVIIPIKNEHGITSTGIDDTGDPWLPRRLTMHEIHDQPVTWSAPNLVFNTGMWIADIRGPWVEQVCFHMEDKIVRGPDGKWEAHVQPEDWHFSRQVRDLGLKVAVTRKIPVTHFGAKEYPNTERWGTMKTDTYAGRDIPAKIPEEKRA